MNLPNQITTTRLILAIVMFVLLAQIDTPRSPDSMLLDFAWGVFLLAAVSDILDGYLARKYNQVTAFGRIADPFVDKILVSGAFVFLIPLTPLIQPWMVVVIIGREFLISGLRGYAESQGIAFPANIWGKSKTLVQCVTVIVVLVYLAHLRDHAWASVLAKSCVWTAVGITILSGYFYLQKSWKLWSVAR